MTTTLDLMQSPRIITDKATGQAVLETFNAKTAAAVNRERYNVQTAREYLETLNATLRAETQKEARL